MPQVWISPAVSWVGRLRQLVIAFGAARYSARYWKSRAVARCTGGHHSCRVLHLPSPVVTRGSVPFCPCADVRHAGSHFAQPPSCRVFDLSPRGWQIHITQFRQGPSANEAHIALNTHMVGSEGGWEVQGRVSSYSLGCVWRGGRSPNRTL